MSQKVKAAIQLEELSPAKQRLLQLMLKKERARKKAEARSTLPLHSGDAPPPASLAQERLWFLQRLVPDSCAYNIPAAVRLLGPLDKAALNESLRLVLQRHEALRTRFLQQEDRLVQVVDPAPNVRVECENLGEIPDEEREDAIQRRAREQNNQPYDLGVGPLLRSLLLQLGKDDHALLINMHHSISDGLSIGLLVREIETAYAALTSGGEPDLPKLAVQYGDYAAWQREELTPQVLEKRLLYWREALTGASTVLEIPTDRPRPPIQGTIGARHFLHISAQMEARLATLAARCSTTPYVAYMTVFNVLLHRYSGQSDFLVGTPISGRAKPELQPLIGFFIDTVVLRADVRGRPSFTEMLNRTREASAGALGHQEVGFENLVEALQPERDLSRHALFQAVFSLQEAPMQKMRSASLEMVPVIVNSGTARFDLELVLWDLDAGLAGLLEYNTDLFDTTTMIRFEKHFQRLLHEAVTAPDTPVDSLPLLDRAERHQISSEWNDTSLELSLPVYIHDLFERQAVERGNAVALVCNGEARDFDLLGAEVTFGALDEAANQLARYLMAQGVVASDLVGINMPRTPEMILAVLAIFKTGAGYVPLDGALPVERLSYMTADADVGFVLTTRGHDLGDFAEGVRTLRIDEVAAEFRAFDSSRPPRPAEPATMAYVIYTSGSTGTPKGVAVEHGPVLNLFHWFYRTFNFGPEDRQLFVTSLSFDLSVVDIFAILGAGGSVYVATEEELRDPERLTHVLMTAGITLWDSAPPTLQQLAPYLPGDGSGESLRVVLTGGDWIPLTLPDQVRETFRDAQFIGLGGATEASIYSNFFPVGEVAPHWVSIPYGRPVTNAHYYVLDGHLAPTPVGVAGDLWIGGECLAAAYAKAPRLTAQKFVPDPFSSVLGGRMYLTGDRSRTFKDGNLEFLGRLDTQVKVRGYRIELGEIETALRILPSVGDAAVVVHGQRAEEKKLLAYVVAADGEVDVTQLRQDLGDCLPAYMVPALFMTLDKLPLTSNGKLDRKALTDINLDRVERETAPFVAPRTATEVILAEMFAHILGVEPVGVDDDFFDLGGQSLLATQLISRIRETLGAELELRSFFEKPTVGALAKILDGDGGPTAKALPPLAPVPRDQPLPLSFAQERLWFLDQLVQDLTAYNVPGLVRMTGRLDIDCLERTFGEIVRRHEVLRTTYERGADGRPVQVVQQPGRFEVPREDLTGEPEDKREELAVALANKMVRTTFDLKKDGIVRPLLLRLGEEDHMLAVAIHHIGFDMWSREHFIRELGLLYQAFSEGRPSPLAEPEVQYADFAHWQRSWMDGDLLETQLGYWREHLDGVDFVLRLPYDRPRAATQSFRGRREVMVLSSDVSDKIRQLSQSRRATPFVALQTVASAFLGRLCGQDDLVVGTPIANRHRREVENLMGFFVNTLLLRARMEDNPTFYELVDRQRTAFFEAFAHQDLAFERLAQELRPDRDRNLQPLFQASFNFLENYVPEPLQFGELTIKLDRRVYNEGVMVDFSLTGFEVQGDFNLVLDYSLDVFDETTALRMLAHLRELVTDAVTHPERRLTELRAATAAERHQVLVEWNDIPRLPELTLVPEQISAISRRLPEAVVVRNGDHELTYADLDRRADQLAHHLCSLGVRPDRMVGVCIPRSPEMVVAQLAVLRAGGAYLPLDPSLPPERLAFMIQDAEVAVLISDAERAARIRLDDALPQVLYEQGEDPFADLPAGPPTTDVGLQNLAYMMYTSGSTGRPKGVTIEHHNLARIVGWYQSVFQLTPEDRVTHVCGLGFDVTVIDVWPTLCAGAALEQPDEETRITAAKLRDWVVERKITVSFMPTPLAEAVLVLDWPEDAAIDRLMAGGDRLQRRAAPNVPFVLHNIYGPTECTVVSTSCPLAPEAPDLLMEPSIGRPVWGLKAYVMDKSLRLNALGARGELFLGGESLARGYYGRPVLTADRFIPNPLADTPGERLYRTGDIVRVRADGRYEFLGREDAQINIRGFRIELGEIEAALNQLPSVRLAVVLAVEVEGEQRLAAHVEPAFSEAPPEPRTLRKELSLSLPLYMVPTYYTVHDALPLTPNGKVNRRALAQQPLAEMVLSVAYVEPQTDLERELADLAVELLGVERLGRDDDFFQAGGHSLLATQLLSQVGARYQLEVPVAVFFESPTVGELARNIEVARWAAGSDELPDDAEELEELEF